MYHKIPCRNNKELVVLFQILNTYLSIYFEIFREILFAYLMMECIKISSKIFRKNALVAQMYNGKFSRQPEKDAYYMKTWWLFSLFLEA